QERDQLKEELREENLIALSKPEGDPLAIRPRFKQRKRNTKNAPAHNW
ncbi:722_t:CDS:2, partial [Paraglomus occultum]